MAEVRNQEDRDGDRGFRGVNVIAIAIGCAGGARE